MKVERATRQNIHPLFKLLSNQFLEHNIHFDDDQLFPALEHLISNKDLGFVLFAQENGKPVGIAVVAFAWTLEHCGKSAWLDEMYVIPEMRNAGIGTVLIEQVIKEARRLGCLALDLEVEHGHGRAEKLYGRMGFQRLDRRRWVKPLTDDT